MELSQAIGLAFALSGWGKVFYDHITSKPKLRGRVFQLLRATWGCPEIHDGRPLAAFIPYLYVVNTRRNAIHVMDYELEIEVDRTWTKLERVFGAHKLSPSAFKPHVEFSKDFATQFIYRRNYPVEFGKPLHGWIFFSGPASLANTRIRRYRVTCIDAYGKRHRSVTAHADLANLFLLQDLADVEISKSIVRSERE